MLQKIQNGRALSFCILTSWTWKDCLCDLPLGPKSFLAASPFQGLVLVLDIFSNSTAFKKFLSFFWNCQSLFVAWSQSFLTEIVSNVLLSNTESFRHRPVWPKWTCYSFSNHTEMPINELMKLSNSLRQLLFSLPGVLIRILYLSPTQATFALKVRILEGHGEKLQITLIWEKLFKVILTESTVKYSLTAK